MDFSSFLFENLLQISSLLTLLEPLSAFQWACQVVFVFFFFHHSLYIAYWQRDCVMSGLTLCLSYQSYSAARPVGQRFEKFYSFPFWFSFSDIINAKVILNPASPLRARLEIKHMCLMVYCTYKNKKLGQFILPLKKQ